MDDKNQQWTEKEMNERTHQWTEKVVNERSQHSTMDRKSDL